MWNFLLTLLCAVSTQSRAEEFLLKAGDVDLPGIFEPAPGFSADKEPRVVVLVHGSGPHDRDENLAAVSAPGKPCVFFRDLSRELRAAGISVARYDKRSFVYRKLLGKEPAAAKSDGFLAYQKASLSATIDDVGRAVAWVRRRAPGARVHLLGHSEGAYVALQTAHRDPGIKGVALVSLPVQPLNVLVFEQTVYRPLSIFEGLDKDHDGGLAAGELAGDDPVQASLRAQISLIDLDRSGGISKAEFMGGNLSNLLAGPPLIPPAVTVEEAGLPPVGEILQKGRFPVAIFAGALDNQTPLYQTYAVSLANDTRWKRKDLSVRVFPGLGHALDPRESASDLVFKPSDPSALSALASDLDRAWK